MDGFGQTVEKIVFISKNDLLYSDIVKFLNEVNSFDRDLRGDGDLRGKLFGDFYGFDNIKNTYPNGNYRHRDMFFEDFGRASHSDDRFSPFRNHLFSYRDSIIKNTVTE